MNCLDYVFGVPLALNYSRIHQNVNMSYYHYSTDEEDFSRQIIRYWANFIKTGSVVFVFLEKKSKSIFLVILAIQIKIFFLHKRMKSNGNHIDVMNTIICSFN